MAQTLIVRPGTFESQYRTNLLPGGHVKVANLSTLKLKDLSIKINLRGSFFRRVCEMKKRTHIDKLVMLLSTDWFLPYWTALGIILKEKDQRLFQMSCREIVKQILSGAYLNQYFLANLSKERVDETKDCLASF